MTRIDRSASSIRPALRGVFTALVTPFAEDGSIDEAALRQLVRWQVLTGIDGLVPVGTTGESPTLTPAERDRVIALTVETVAERPSRSRVTIVAGTGTNDTAATVAATRRAAELGADAAPAQPVTIAGPLCSGLDVFARRVALVPPEVGDLLAVLDVGAYGYTESMPLFLSHPSPAEIAIRGGRAVLIRPRVEPAEWLDRQLLPEW